MKRHKATPKVRGRPQKYDWDKLLNGKLHELKRGTHFSCYTSSFQMLAHQAAYKRGINVITRRKDDQTMTLIAVRK